MSQTFMGFGAMSVPSASGAESAVKIKKECMSPTAPQPTPQWVFMALNIASCNASYAKWSTVIAVLQAAAIQASSAGMPVAVVKLIMQAVDAAFAAKAKKATANHFMVMWIKAKQAVVSYIKPSLGGLGFPRRHGGSRPPRTWSCSRCVRTAQGNQTKHICDRCFVGKPR
ncbi:MAG: hypothetical protein UY96_C0010G0005 [Parcubacteria group bacterium GW2011_GWB1_56_8]|nr:MAG: hypothetical protein UY96_C0010G0005 [Parcubacteria group bacterium GW2011_GWB1_56_8]